MKPTPGKLTNKDSGESLPFSLNPTDYKIDRQFDFAVEPCLGQTAPVVAFRSGGLTQLSFQLRFDKDADKDFDIKKVDIFIKGLNKVDEAKRSVPLIEFAFGSFKFTGFPSSYSYHALRFDNHGEVTSLKMAFTLLSNGEYENGK